MAVMCIEAYKPVYSCKQDGTHWATNQTEKTGTPEAGREEQRQQEMEVDKRQEGGACRHIMCTCKNVTMKPIMSCN